MHQSLVMKNKRWEITPTFFYPLFCLSLTKAYRPEELIGKKVVLVANLKPAVLCGVESRGMILASGEEEIKVLFADPAAANGSRVH